MIYFMHIKLKNAISALLMVFLLLPSIFFGILPPQKIYAQDAMATIAGGISSALVCSYGDEITEFASDALSGISDVIGIDIGGIMDGDVNSMLDSVMGGLGVGGSGGDSVPTNETNPDMLADIDTTADSTANLKIKECILDAIVWAAKELLISQITGSMLDWISAGFDSDGVDGGDTTVFITDPDQFFLSVARGAFNSFLEEINNRVADNQSLCEPFAENVIQQVTLLGQQSTYGESGDKTCSYASVFGDDAWQDAYNSMINDGNISFDGGGLLNAMSIVSDGNNEYSAFFDLQNEAMQQTSRAVAYEATLADWSNGYFAMRAYTDDQTEIQNDDGTTEPARRKVVTPGDLVAKQVNKWLSGGLEQLEAADEISEFVSELITWLVDSIFKEGFFVSDDVFSSGMEAIQSNIENNEPAQVPEPSNDGTGDNRFLWKPISENTHTLVILLPARYPDGCTVTVGGETSSCSVRSNGNRPTCRFSRPGCSYGTNITISVSCPGESHTHIHSDGCQRSY